jgi:predicted O-methyltransferase YrrM
MGKIKKKLGSIFTEGLEDWIDIHTPRPSDLFSIMEEEAYRTDIPILSPSAGAVLKYLIQTHKRVNILELGTGLGYSIAWMLSVSFSISITTIDRNAGAIASARSYIEPELKRTGSKVEFIHGNCLEYVKEAQSLAQYDFVFVDCDKVTYPELLAQLLTKMKIGTFILVDNVLWHGRLDPNKFEKPSDKSIQEFWNKLQSVPNTRTLFPAGDGLLFIEV